MSAFADLLLSSILVLSDNAKETMFFVGDASGEKDAIAQREKIPQAVKLEGRSIGAHERLDKSARDWIVIVDEAVTKIGDPEVAIIRRKYPWGAEVAVLVEAA